MGLITVPVNENMLRECFINTPISDCSLKVQNVQFFKFFKKKSLGNIPFDHFTNIMGTLFETLFLNVL